MARRPLILVCLALLAVALMLGYTGAYARSGAAVPGRDAGLFLYVGQTALHGQLPYRDTWDHKGPLLYGIEALGLWIGHGSATGVLALEIVAVAAAAIIGYLLLVQTTGPAAALFASLLWLLALPHLLEGGNYTEEFALPLQFGALYICAQGTGSPARRAALAGALVGLTLLLQPNLVAVPLAALACMVVRGFSPQILRPDKWYRRLAAWTRPQDDSAQADERGARQSAIRSPQSAIVLAAVVGLAAPIILVCSYFAARGGLAALWDAYIRYNLTYVATMPGARLLALAYGAALMVAAGLGIAAIGGYWVLLAQPRGWAIPADAASLRVLLLCAVPLDLLLTMLLGRSYLHYYVTWLPGLAALSALFASAALAQDAVRQNGHQERSQKTRVRVAAVILMGSLVVAMGSSYFSLPGPASAARTDVRASKRDAAVTYVAGHTRMGDTVLVWGAETAVNFLTQRPSPSRYSYQYPLFTRGYATDARAQVFLDDLMQRPPTLIIDAAVETPGALVPPLDAAARGRWSAGRAYTGPAALANVYDYIAAHYRPAAAIGENAWAIYRRIEDVPAGGAGHDAQP
jgi:hypothetical protein